MESTSSSAPVAETSRSESSDHSPRGNKLRKLAEFLECCICQQDMRDARICGQCSQPFCRSCIDQWLKKEQNCPHCRRALTEQGIIEVRTFDQLGDVVDELLADEKQNRCQSHNREQLFYCFLCEESICDRCAFELIHLEHRDKVVLLDVAFDHFNKNTSNDFEWIKNKAHTLAKQQDRIQKNKKLLKVEFERVDAIIRRTSESISAQYAEKSNKQQEFQETVEKHSISITAMLEKSKTLETKKKTASTLEHLIKFKNEVEVLRSDLYPIIRWVDLRFENNFIPNPVRITFDVNLKDQCCESTANGMDSFVWKMKLSPSNGCPSLSLLLEQGNPGAYWVACHANTAELYEFELHKYVEIEVQNFADIFNRYQDRAKVVISISHAQSYAERCQQQQNYIGRLEKKIENYEKVLTDIREKAGSLESNDGSESETDDS